MKHLNVAVSLLLLSFSIAGTAQRHMIPAGLKQNEYIPNQLIFKLKDAHREAVTYSVTALPSFDRVIEKIGGGTVEKNFPTAVSPGKKVNKNGERLADLSLIYELRYEGSMHVRDAAILLEKSGMVEWVQPRYVEQPMFTPDDPKLGQQYHHALIKSFEAWDIEQGDTNVVVAVTDNGVLFTHEDFGNVKYNYADPVNGMDDDNDGYVDNFRGWNFPANTNDPTATLSLHGIFTTGLSSAPVNNGKGIAGTGFNCKVLPLRIDGPQGITHGYEAVVYAADHGCRIINASWGKNIHTPLGEEAVRYATVNKGCLLVAAAGNSGLNEKYYPAAYEHVFSIGATNASELKWSGSTYGPSVDLVAPGESVYSLHPFAPYYNTSSGTSFSAPIVAGAAALVQSHFPHYTPLQVAERLRVTADTALFSLPGNADYRELMGAGRLNMYRALNDPERPSVHFRNVQLRDNDGDDFLVAGDDVMVSGDFFNYLAITQNMEVRISCASPHVAVTSATFVAGVIPTLESKSNAAAPFSFRILETAPHNLDLIFKVSYTDAGYSAFELFEVRVNKDYMDLAVNRIGVTLTSRGNIGYNDDFAGSGIGFTYDSGKSLLYYSGLMLGTAAGDVADNAYAAVLPGYDADFVRQQAVKEVMSPVPGMKQIESSYYTDSAAASRLLVRQTASAMEGNDAWILMEYSIKNTGVEAVHGLSGGLFTDWEIDNSTGNLGGYDAQQRLSYAYAPGGLYAGAKLLNVETPHAYCFNSDGTGGSVNLYDGFSDAEKFATLSGGQTRHTVVQGDVANLLSAGPFDLAPGDSVQLAFVLLAGDSLEQLKNRASRAEAVFLFTQLDAYINVLHETCAANDGAVDLIFRETESLAVALLNGDGVVLREEEDAGSSFLYGGLPAGNYSLKFTFSNGLEYITAFTVAPSDPLSVQISADILEILEGQTISFAAVAEGAEYYSWDFGDGELSSEQHPEHTYAQQGEYTVQLIGWNASCSDTAYAQVQVNTTVNLRHPENGVQVYPNPAKEQLTVRLTGAWKDAGLRLFSLTGQLVHAQTADSLTVINTAVLPAGIYLLEITGGEKRLLRKVVVQP